MSLENSLKLKLIIRAANQRYEDFVVDEFELDWSIKQLKLYLTENYPQKPDYVTIRLIYSGKMLHDHWTLNECIRHNSEVTSHIIHLVLAAATATIIKPSMANTSFIDQDDGENNELTPDTSSMSSTDSNSSTSSSSSIFSTPVPTTTIQPDLNNSLQQFELIHSDYIRQYESMGIMNIQENAWFSTYVQQLALYKHMYSNYLQAQSTDPFVPNPINNSQQQATSNEQQPDPPQEQQEAVPAAAAPPVEQVERDDDWLSLLHTIVSFLVLLSIIYYYSSLERFLVIFAIVVALIVYHNGWLSLQRRQIQPRTPAQAANNENAENEQQTPAGSNNNPNYFRLFISFVLTFFTSLIPERPRIGN